MRKILLTLLSVAALAALVGCGTHSATIFVPTNPSGGNPVGFSDASLSGTYVFTANGLTSRSSFAAAGIFTADGAGIITSGTRDTVHDTGRQALGESITGTYSVNQDGRGQVVLNGNSGQAIYRFVLQSPSSGKLFQDGTTSNRVIVDAIGTIELQSPPATTLSGTYVIRLDGEDPRLFPYGAVGGLTASGTTLNGSIDENDAGLVAPVSLQLPATGSYTLASSGRGIATLTTPTGPNSAAHNFIVYFVSPNRLELISTDPRFFLHGRADLQTSVAGTVALFTGPQVFSISGTDFNLNPVQETGRFTLDGLGTLVNGIADFNDTGNLLTGITVTGNYSVAASGRWLTNLNSSGIASSLGLVGWQVSPQQSVVLTTDTSLLETGTMRAQTPAGLTLTTAGVTGQYADALAGFNGTGFGNFESTGNLFADGLGGLSGFIDSQTDSSGLDFDASTTGSYSFTDPTTGRGTGFIGSIPVTYYAVDPSTLFVFSTDSNSLFQGTLVKQQP
jgi:hypothetical protein